MRWWREWRGYTFPRNWNHVDHGPLEPRSLSRALVRAARKDARNARRNGTIGGSVAAQAPYSAMVIARLPERTRREVAHRLQRERTRLSSCDTEWWAAGALAHAHCGWSREEALGLFALAFEGVDERRPTTRWSGAGRALELPLAALEELPTADREPFLPYLRTALTIRHNCTGEATLRDGAPTAEDDALTGRLLRLFDPPYDVDALLPEGDPFATAARCGLGTAVYEPQVLELLRACAELGERAEPADQPPSYEWLGRTSELLQRSAADRRALRTLLGAAEGKPRDCPGSDRHRGGFSATSGRLLAALAWAACVSHNVEVTRELGRALVAHSRRPLGETPEGPALFLRGGLAALAALAGEPGPGGAPSPLAEGPGHVAALARELLREVRQQPAGWDGTALSYPVGKYTALFTVTSAGAVALGFRNRHGRLLPEVPGQVVAGHPAVHAGLRSRLAELRAQVDAHLGALAERLHTDPGLPAARWQAAQLDEPALEPLTRALIWQADTPLGPVVGLPVRRKRSTVWVLRDLGGRFRELADDTPVRLWDARSADAAEVAAWRAALDDQRLVQPVAQLPPPQGG